VTITSRVIINGELSHSGDGSTSSRKLQGILPIELGENLPLLHLSSPFNISSGDTCRLEAISAVLLGLAVSVDTDSRAPWLLNVPIRKQKIPPWPVRSYMYHYSSLALKKSHVGISPTCYLYSHNRRRVADAEGNILLTRGTYSGSSSIRGPIHPDVSI
jgi:hypothetical protein